ALNREKTFEPRTLTAPRLTTAIRASSRPYSASVAPSSFRTKQLRTILCSEARGRNMRGILVAKGQAKGQERTYPYGSTNLPGRTAGRFIRSHRQLGSEAHFSIEGTSLAVCRAKGAFPLHLHRAGNRLEQAVDVRAEELDRGEADDGDQGEQQAVLGQR